MMSNIAIHKWLVGLFSTLEKGKSAPVNQIVMDSKTRKLDEKKIIKPAPKVNSLTYEWNKLLASLGFVGIFHLRNKGP